MRSLLLQDLSISSEESKEIAKLYTRKRGIKDYESMPEDRLLNALISSKPIKKGEKPKFPKARIGKIERKFNESRHKFSKPNNKGD